MGNFYSNFTVLGASADDALAAAKEERRSAFVIQGSPGMVIFCDEACDEQDTDEIERVGAALSSRLDAPVIGCLNHDDDHLLLWLFEHGEKRAFYRSWVDGPGFAWSLSRVRGGMLAYPLIAAVLGWPVVLFQIWRHKALANLLSLPPSAVGFGYTYLARGELPPGLSSDDIRQA